MDLCYEGVHAACCCTKPGPPKYSKKLLQRPRNKGFHGHYVGYLEGAGESERASKPCSREGQHGVSYFHCWLQHSAWEHVRMHEGGDGAPWVRIAHAEVDSVNMLPLRN